MLGVNLFPLSKELEKLKKFFPAGQLFRRLYLLLATVVSVLVSLSIELNFEGLERFCFFIDFWEALIMALVIVLIYTFIHISFIDRVNKPDFPKLKKASYVIVSILLYVMFNVLLTYSFSLLKNQTKFYIIKGTIEGENIKVEKNVEILLLSVGDTGDKKTPKNSKKNGDFFFIIRKHEFEKLYTVIFKAEVNGEQYQSIKSKTELPPNQKWYIYLKRVEVE